MIDSQTQMLLQDILRRERCSVLQYVAEAFPWTTSTETKSLASLQHLIAAEREAMIGLWQYMLRQRIRLPYLPSYPANFTTINFLAFDYVVPMLIEHQRQSIADLERDLAALKDPGVRAEIEKLLTVKRQHLLQLEALVSSQPQASLT
ncbi:MAG TPA: hypothetical protein VN688_12825 [Gemmataceae bacterium]|nr:hypothetical protein [Gemmataceae bacterium]